MAYMQKFLAAVLVVLALNGCATPLSYREKGFMMGAAIGGGTGALVGWRLRHPREGAAIGAGIGALTGALVGSALDGVRQAVASDPAAAPAPSAPPASAASPPVSPGPLPPSGSAIQVPGAYGGDPTAGSFVNATPWEVRVTVDAAPGQPGGASFIFGPGQSQPAHLDIGPHRIWAEGWVQTRLGPRLVGRSDQTLHVDARGSGWSLRFDPGEFR